MFVCRCKRQNQKPVIKHHSSCKSMQPLYHIIQTIMFRINPRTSRRNDSTFKSLSCKSIVTYKNISITSNSSCSSNNSNSNNSNDDDGDDDDDNNKHQPPTTKHQQPQCPPHTLEHPEEKTNKLHNTAPAAAGMAPGAAAAAALRNIHGVPLQCGGLRAVSSAAGYCWSRCSWTNMYSIILEV